MPAIRRLLVGLPLLLALPAGAQNLAATGDILPARATPAQATPGSPPSTGAPPAASTPAQPGAPAANPPALPGQSLPSRGGGYQCERSRPTS